jgi:hypothetical protein
VSIETLSSPESLAATLRSFTFYVTHAIRSVRVHSWLAFMCATQR